MAVITRGHEDISHVPNIDRVRKAYNYRNVSIIYRCILSKMVKNMDALVVYRACFKSLQLFL